MLGFDPVASRANSSILGTSTQGQSQYPAFIPALNSPLSEAFSPPIGGFDAPYAFSLGLYGKPTSVATIIPQVIWHLRQQGNS